MTIGLEGTAEPPPAGDDAVRPFAVEALDVRGRAIQMGPALDAILARHDYPPPVSRLLGRGDRAGRAARLVAEVRRQVHPADPDRRAGRHAGRRLPRTPARSAPTPASMPGPVAAAEARGRPPAGTLLGKGTLAMTIDQGRTASRYQGVVPLEGESLEEVAHTYFRQSEQIPTRVRLAVAEMQKREGRTLRLAWRAGGLLVQFLPDAPERMRQPDLPGGDAPGGHRRRGRPRRTTPGARPVATSAPSRTTS